MSPKLIVLVEDDVNLRQSIALILQRAGYLVSATDCVYKGMDLLRSGIYKLIISDINIPETKKVLIPKILGTFSNVSVVILTDQTIPDSEKGGKLLSAHYLAKPLAPERLLDCVGMIFGKVNGSNHTKDNNLPNNHNKDLQQSSS